MISRTVGSQGGRDSRFIEFVGLAFSRRETFVETREGRFRERPFFLAAQCDNRFSDMRQTQA